MALQPAFHVEHFLEDLFKHPNHEIMSVVDRVTAKYYPIHAKVAKSVALMLA